jgi:LysR family transcriptional regulator, low CO2-responsive transcriptional regulator
MVNPTSHHSHGMRRLYTPLPQVIPPRGFQKSLHWKGGSALDLPETRHLVAFTTVLEAGGFTRAAEVLNLTQSALSHQIKTLEELLGVEVFARIGKRTILTQAGEILLKHATVVLRELADARQSLLELRDPGRGRLRISAAGYSCYLLLPRILREFKGAYPRVELSVAADYTGEAVQHLMEGMLDIAILVAPPPVRGLAFEPLAEDELFVIAPAEHSWAKRRRMRWGELATQVLITYNKASLTHQLLLDRLAKEEAGTPETMEVREAEAVTEMVKVGLGIAVLPLWVVRADLQARRLVALPLGRTGLKRSWAIAYVPGRQLPPYSQTFIRICRERFSALMEAGGLERIDAELPHMATVW